jgi:glycerate-2-kinase
VWPAKPWRILSGLAAPKTRPHLPADGANTSLLCRHWAASATAAIVALGEQFGRRHACSCGLAGRCTGARAWQRGMSVRKALVAGEASAVLQACGDAIVTGMAWTNANDLVLIVVR